MSEKPIIFKPEMVKAILNGTKTVTRRVIKTPPCEIHEQGGYITVTKPRKFKDEYARLCPYEPYHVGDILWVRETWSIHPLTKPDNLSELGYCSVCTACKKRKGKYIYKASFPKSYPCTGWKPSIHMKREAARIFLKIKSISVGRLQDIGEKDAKAEGVEPINPLDLKQLPMSLIEPGGKYGKGVIRNTSYRAAFYELWEKINAERGYSWDSNPWVWVIEFKRINK